MAIRDDHWELLRPTTLTKARLANMQFRLMEPAGGVKDICTQVFHCDRLADLEALAREVAELKRQLLEAEDD